jgi:hypothetical protein
MPIPAIVVTIEVPGGPTVRLDYDPARADGRPTPQRQGAKPVVWTGTTVALWHQGGAMSPEDAILTACTYLFACYMDGDHWPADLRPTVTEAEP